MATSGRRSSSGGGAKAAMKGGGVYVGNGATVTQGRGVVSGSTAGDGEDVYRTR
ncbi:MAG: hypothetical protein LBB61_10770 [Treponema sp.]|nr:hypothetical protein [Treponema sp.]